MAYIDFMSPLHKATKRDYLARVNDPDFPKAKAAELAKQWGYDYWDGDRRINYGGYNYIPGRWAPVAEKMVEHYQLKRGSKVLDIGCGKGFLLYELSRFVPGIEVFGVDISKYAIDNSHEAVKDHLQLGSADNLPFTNRTMDLIVSINTLHNLKCFELDRALREIERVSRGNSYVCVESYRNEKEKVNLLYWQVTCESFYGPEEWEWWFSKTGFSGDFSFIYFE